MNILQSMVKAYEDYRSGGLCGYIFEKQYIKKDYPDISSPAQGLGCYFEYLVTGALPKSGKIPEPKWLKSALKKPAEKREVSDMMSEYRLATMNADRVKGYLSSIGLNVKASGFKKAENGLEGTCDILGELGGNNVIVDLKYSGLLTDKYQPFGWGALEIDGYYGDQQRSFHSKQAAQYSILFGVDEFYYLVCSSTNIYDIGFFKFEITEEGKRTYIALTNWVRENVEIDKTVGFKPYPEVIRCTQCIMKNYCKDAIFYPEPKSIKITAEEIWKT